MVMQRIRKIFFLIFVLLYGQILSFCFLPSIYQCYAETNDYEIEHTGFSQKIQKSGKPFSARHYTKTGVKRQVQIEEDKNGWMNEGSCNLNGYGTAGRLEIPELGISVALYWVSIWDYDAQYVCDLQDSAVRYSDLYIIGDHNNQAFCTLSSAHKGTNAYIYHNDGNYEQFTCVDTGMGIHDGYHIYDQYGRVDSEFTELTIYTCHGSWQTPFMSQWVKN